MATNAWLNGYSFQMTRARICRAILTFISLFVIVMMQMLIVKDDEELMTAFSLHHVSDILLSRYLVITIGSSEISKVTSTT